MTMSEGEHQSEGHKRIDLKSEVGMTRRDLIRRGAVVGTLVWAVPVISSVNQKAFAESAPGAHSASGDITYHVDTADPGLSRHAVFSFTDANTGTFAYNDINTSYTVAISVTLFSGNTAWACGQITGGGAGLNGQFLAIRVTDSPDSSGGDVFNSCPSLPFVPSTFATIDSGDIIVT
jgi:hypothetical protein